MRLLLLLSFFAGIGTTMSVAQSTPALSKIDSLKSLSITSSDSTLVDIYNQISWGYRNIDIDSSIHFAQQALWLSREMSYLNGINHSLNYLGIAYRNRSNYSKALELFFEALKSSEYSKDLQEISYTLINIGNIYIFQTNYQGAIDYFQRALENAKIINDGNIMAYCYLNIGRSLVGLEQYSKAEEYYRQAQELRTKMNDLEGMVISNVDMAELYIKTNLPDKALSLLTENLINVKRLNHTSTLSLSYINIARCHIMKNNTVKAKAFIQKSMTLNEAHGLKSNQSQALQLLSEISEKSNNYNQALNYFKLYVATKDSIFNEENTRKIESLHAQYQTEKAEVETKYLREQTRLNQVIIERQRAIITLAVVACLLFLTVAIIAFWSSNERKKLNAQIEDQKERAYKHNNDLIDINNEKNNLIRILSHDLRAPINNIKGLTEIHQSEHQEFGASENHTLNLIKSESDRILSMISKILNVEALSTTPKTANKERVNIVKVMNDTITSFNSTARAKNITIKGEISEKACIILGDDIHLHQVLENLVSNAVKFSNPDTTITLQLNVVGKSVQLSVQDQGPGLTEDDKNKIFKKFQTLSAKPTANEVSTGLGLSIVKKYVEQMNGKIWYESELGEGTKFTVQFELA
ncbi:MAG: tetratricopeptide repeat-containing sensor histidine kinase [Reichenbachiella sp.]|uniref:tetratricopeptide repeat-containing sensor histidine kinase n=1 Tax=Reichenbachiella sp. TaxID=2184521 RepID=UPI002966615D|nr:tetratricopeptide repeat-containing sensor histidine kinase [Reichenbachiella sp.]MDW3210349.1 tetratricopeptide repeat-containing sensor histidine kinase [Reichenbachiella sp.]